MIRHSRNTTNRYLHALRRLTTIAGSTQGDDGSLLRFDVTTGTWVLFSSERRNRPQQTSTYHSKIRLAGQPQIASDCPFCAGNEHMTPHELLTNNGMRVVANKYPAIQPLTKQQDSDQDCEHFRRRHHRSHDMSFLVDDGVLLDKQVPAVGFHEVVIESPYHNQHIATSLHHGMACDLLTVFRDRGLEHQANELIEHTVFFKNHGSTAGASIVHPHSQIVSTTVVPVEAQRLQSLAWNYFKRNRRNLYEQVVEEELAVHRGTHTNSNTTTTTTTSSGRYSSRVVDITQHFIALVPFASAAPYVIKILPRYQTHGPNVAADSSVFTTTTDDLLEECATLLHSCLSRLHKHLDEPDFNLVVQTAPAPGRGVQAALNASAFFRWHIRITPRLGAGAMAGFELGSGFFSNSHLPEEDAAELRNHGSMSCPDYFEMK